MGSAQSPGGGEEVGTLHFSCTVAPDSVGYLMMLKSGRRSDRYEPRGYHHVSRYPASSTSPKFLDLDLGLRTETPVSIGCGGTLGFASSAPPPYGEYCVSV